MILRIKNFNNVVVKEDLHFQGGLKTILAKNIVDDFDTIELIDNEKNIHKKYKVSLVPIKSNTYVKNSKKGLVKVDRIYILTSHMSDSLYFYRTENNRIHQNSKINVVYR